MTIPNLITSLRIILVPILIIYIIHDRLLSALFVFVLAGLSDGADGLIARLFDQKSKLGAYMDPLADKFLLIAAFITLAMRGLLPPWLTVIVISRDILILLGVLILFLNRIEVTIRPSILSKMNTCVQPATVFVVLSKNNFSFLGPIAHYVFWFTGVLTISSGLHYMSVWFQMVSKSPLSNMNRGDELKER